MTTFLSIIGVPYCLFIIFSSLAFLIEYDGNWWIDDLKSLYKLIFAYQIVTYNHIKQKLNKVGIFIVLFLVTVTYLPLMILEILLVTLWSIIYGIWILFCKVFKRRIK